MPVPSLADIFFDTIFSPAALQMVTYFFAILTSPLTVRAGRTVTLLPAAMGATVILLIVTPVAASAVAGVRSPTTGASRTMMSAFMRMSTPLR